MKKPKKTKKAPIKIAKSKKIEITYDDDDLGGDIEVTFDDDEEKSPQKEESAEENPKHMIKSSKPISQIKKGDKIKIDSLTLEVDSHYILINHPTTKEMAIELFDPKTDKDYQLRYFSDQAERTLEFYELDEIIYNKVDFLRIEW